MLPIKIILHFIPLRSVKIYNTRGIEVCGLGIHSDKVLFCLWCRMVPPPPPREASLHRKPLTNENFRGLKQKRLLAAATHVNPAEEDFFPCLDSSCAQILESLSFAYTANDIRQIQVENFSK